MDDFLIEEFKKKEQKKSNDLFIQLEIPLCPNTEQPHVNEDDSSIKKEHKFEIDDYGVIF